MKLIQNSKRQPSESEKQEYLNRGHRKPVSRRDFLARSGQAGLGFVLVPSLVSQLKSELYGQSLSCSTPPSQASDLFPIVFLDFEGGGAFGNDFVVGGTAGQLDLITGTAAYENYGIPDDNNYNAPGVTPDTSFGVAFHPESPFMQGLKSVLPVQYWNSVDGFIIAAETDDDTENNPLGGLQYASILGRSGLLVPTIGTENKASGGRHKTAENAEVPQYSPVRVVDQGTARRVGGSGNMFQPDRLGEAKAQRVLQAISRLSTSQLDQFNNLALTEQQNLLIRCGYLNSVDLPSLYSPEVIFPQNPAGDDPIRTAFGGQFAGRSASIARLVMNEYAGAGCEALGGYDNHDGTSVNPNNRRYQAGQTVGRYIYYAALLGKPLYLCCTTDGGMGVERNSGVLQVDTSGPGAGQTVGGLGFARRPGDNGNTSVQFVMVYHPDATRGDLVASTGRQVGAFRKEGVIRDYLITAKNPTRVAQVMLYNYLILQNRADELVRITGGNNPFAGPDLAKYQILKRAPGV